MASLKRQHWIVISFFLVSSLLTGCGTTPPSRYYMLNGIPQVTSENPLSQNATKIHIGIGPITFPKYLDRYAIVIRSEGAELIINDLHLWAEPLADNFTRVLSDNIYFLIDGADTSIYPWQNQNDIDYQVIVDVLRFDADVKNKILLNARWTIYGKTGRDLLFNQNSMIKENASNNDYVTLVSAQNKALANLSREIADKLMEMIAQRN